MKRTACSWMPYLLLCGLLLCTALFPPRLLVVQAQSNLIQDYVPGEVIVKLRGPGNSNLNKIAKDYNLDKRPIDQFGRRLIYRLHILDGMAVPNKAALLRQDARVEFAEPNYVNSIPEDGGKRWRTGESSSAPPSNWALERMQVTKAPGRGAGITVAVLDTGVDTKHPALRGKLVPGYDFVDDDRRPDERGARSDAGYGHGTHVAGLVAQVAPEAKIMPIRVLDSHGMGNIWVLAEALEFALDPNGDGNRSDGADIINLSLVADRKTSLTQDILRDSSTFNVVVVAAAGNDDDGNPNTPVGEVYPAAEPGVVGVAATDQNDTKAPFSNHSASYVDISAPGVDIGGLAPNRRYATWSGTSMAAPLVAGAAAALWSVNPRLSSSELIAQLRASVTPIDTRNPAYAGQLGSGRISFAPTAATPFLPLTLTSMCIVDAAAGVARWRVSNNNSYSVSYTWEIYGGSQRGERVVAANSDDSFEAPVGTMVIRANGQQDVKATNPAPCTTAASPLHEIGAATYYQLAS
jgi:thermitase